MQRHWTLETPLGRNLEIFARALLDDLRPLAMPAGHALFSSGAACAGFPLVLRGLVRVSLAGENGRGLALYRVGPDDICLQSTLCLMAGKPYSADAVVEADISLVLIPPARFDRLVAESRVFRTFVFERFGSRLQDVTNLLEEVAFGSLDMRLARALCARSAQTAYIQATHQQLADEVGAAREAVTRRLNFLARAGLVNISRGAIEILDRTALEEIFGRGR